MVGLKRRKNMKRKWWRNILLSCGLVSVLGLTACSGSFTNNDGTTTDISTTFGKVALVEYTNPNTLFTDYNGQQYTYRQIVDRQITAMAEDIASRLWSVYGTTHGQDISIGDKLNGGVFLTETVKNLVVNQVMQSTADTNDVRQPVSIAITLNDEGPYTVYATNNPQDPIDTSGLQTAYLDVTLDEKGNVLSNSVTNTVGAYEKYNHYYVAQNNVTPSQYYGVILQNNQASLFNNLSNLLYTMNEVMSDGQKGTIIHQDIDQDDVDYVYSLANVLNFSNSIEGGNRWSVYATYNDNGTSEPVGDEDVTLDDYYEFEFSFGLVQTPSKENDKTLNISQDPWQIVQDYPTTIDQNILTTVLKKYIASIIASNGDEEVYLDLDVYSSASDTAYDRTIDSINYTANWIDLYYEDILNVIKGNIIGSTLWDNDIQYGTYLQQLSDDLYDLVTRYQDNIESVISNSYFDLDKEQPRFSYNIIDSDYIKTFLNIGDKSFYNQGENLAEIWGYIQPFLDQYLQARNYQGYELLIPSMIRSSANHTYAMESEAKSRWYVSSKSAVTVYDSQDDFAGEDMEILPAKEYKSVLFFAKEAVDLTQDYNIWFFFGNVSQAFAVRPIITICSGTTSEQEITTLTMEDYTISELTASDSDFVGGDRTTGQYIVKTDDQYITDMGQDYAGFELELHKGSIASAGIYDATANPTIADNDWVLSRADDSIDTILNAVNYIQISFEVFDLEGQPLEENIPFGFSIQVLNA